MVRLKHANDEKSTTGGREFHTFITLCKEILTCSWFTDPTARHVRAGPSAGLQQES